jgi:predicted permease
MGPLFRDVRYGLRAIVRAPVLFGAAVLTLAIGTGLATGVLAVAYGVLLRPLPYPDPERLVSITVHQAGDEGRASGIRLKELEDWRSRFRAFERVGAHSTGEFTVRGAGEARSVRTAMITDGFFETFGLEAADGSAASVARGAATAAISRRLAGQLGMVGPWRERGLTIGTGGFRVGAIMPDAFAEPSGNVDLWLRADEVPEVRLLGFEDQRRFQLAGRLAPGITIEQAREDARRVAREIGAGQPPGRQRDATVRPLRERSRQDARATVIPFLIGAGLVLLVACANVSGLLVGRAAGREREFAVRRALGGSAGQILRASLAESFTIALAGWALGLWGAHLVVRVFETRAAESLPNLEAVRIDAPVVFLSLGVVVLVALLSGGGPALRAARTDPNAALKSGSERIGRGASAARGTLVVAQIALTVVLLVSAGLLLRTVQRIISQARGFTAENSLAMRLRLTQNPRFEVHDRSPFIDRLLTGVRSLPGVAAAGVGSDLPPNGTQLEYTIRVVSDNREETFALNPAAVTPGYLEALGVTLVSGRLFDERDRVASTPPIVISEAAARLFYQGRDPVGREWPAALPGSAGKRGRPLVIGVVRDIKHKGLDEAAPAVLYVPWEILAPSNAHLVVRTQGAPESVGPALRRLVHELDPALPIFPPETLDEVVARSMADRRLRLQLAGAFAGLALMLAGIALWGAMAQTVLDRRRELAVRLALGSTSAGAVRVVLRRGLALIALGVAIGAAAGAVSARMLQHLLHGVTPLDPISFAAGILLAAVISAAACYLPARRAAAISPAELLKEV